MKANPKEGSRSQPASTRFDLRIERDGSGFRASVIDAQVGNAETRFSQPFKDEDLVRFRHAIEHPERDFIREGANLDEIFKRLGTDLFQAVFSGGVLTAWRDALGRAAAANQRVTLSLHLRDSELESWPWESLRDPHQDAYLALSPRTPLLRFPVPPSRIPALRIEGPVRILGIVPHPGGCAPLEGEREWSLLQSSLSKLVETGKVTLDRLQPATLSSLRRKLAEGPFHVLHFIGHGTFDKVKKQGALVFDGEEGGRASEVSASELGTLLSEEDLRLVVLNACYGAKGTVDDPFGAVAANLVRRKVAAVVAMQFSVTDAFAVEFSELFYRRLAAGEPVDLAMAETRLDLLARKHEVEWRKPILYMSSSETKLIDVQTVGPGNGWPPPWLKAAGAVLVGGGLTAASLVWAPTPQPSPECPSPPGLDIKFRLIRPGSTITGNNSLLSVQGPYCIGMYELTRSQQAQILGAPPIPAPEGDLPASALSYENTETIMQALNRRDLSGHYRLPTGKQWEYAARGGTGGVAHFGANLGLLPEYGNCTGSDTGAKPVGSYKPNKFGLFDMYGNVSEWTSDFDVDKDGHVIRYRRGGGWRIEPKNCNSVQEFRSRSEDTNRKDFGLRLVRDPVPAAKTRR